MSLKRTENALMQAEELLAVKDKRIKELERLLLKAQVLLHNAGVTDVLTGSIDETRQETGGKTETLHTAVDVAGMTTGPVNLDGCVSSQPTDATHTPSSEAPFCSRVSTEISTSWHANLDTVSAPNGSPLATSASPNSKEVVHADTTTENASLPASPCKTAVVSVTTRECHTFSHVSSVTTSCSFDSIVPSLKQTDSTQVVPILNNSLPTSLNSVAVGSPPASIVPESNGATVSVSSSLITPDSCASASDASTSTMSSPGTTSGSFASTSDVSTVTLPLPGTTSGSSVSTASSNIVTVQLPTTTCTDFATEHFQSKSHSTQATSCKALVTVESSDPSTHVSFERSQEALAYTNSVFSSSGPKVTSNVTGKMHDTKNVKFASTIAEANLRGQLGEVDIYFADDLENFDIAQEETVSMESDTMKHGDDIDVEDDEETFVPPAVESHSAIGKGCRTHGKSLPDLFDFNCQEQNHQPTKRLQQNLCGECGKTFASKRILRQHIKIIHESEQTYVCNICQKVFRHLHNLTIHKQNQNHFREGEEHLVKDRKLFKCSACPKTFRQKSNLQDHLRLHSDERPFGCSYCDRRFAQISNCRKHELTHTGKRPYSCDNCHKTFTSSSNLKRHQVAHDQNKNYLCPVCGKVFTQKWNLTKHEKKHKAYHKSESSESILLSNNDAVISSPAIEVKVLQFL